MKRGDQVETKPRVLWYRKFCITMLEKGFKANITSRLCADIMRSFILLDEETQQRNIVAWRPVVIDVLEGYTNFPKDSFSKHLETFYPLSVGLLEREIGTELRAALWGMFRRVGEVQFGMPELAISRGRDNSVSSVSRMSRNGSISATPASPSQSAREFESGRRASRNSRTGAV